MHLGIRYVKACPFSANHRSHSNKLPANRFNYSYLTDLDLRYRICGSQVNILLCARYVSIVLWHKNCSLSLSCALSLHWILFIDVKVNWCWWWWTRSHNASLHTLASSSCSGTPNRWICCCRCLCHSVSCLSSFMHKRVSVFFFYIVVVSTRLCFSPASRCSTQKIMISKGIGRIVSNLTYVNRRQRLTDYYSIYALARDIFVHDIHAQSIVNAIHIWFFILQ